MRTSVTTKKVSIKTPDYDVVMMYSIIITRKDSHVRTLEPIGANGYVDGPHRGHDSVIESRA